MKSCNQKEDVGWIASRITKERQVLAFSGADPATIRESLGELVGSPQITSVDSSGNIVSREGVSTPSVALLQREDLAVATAGSGRNTPASSMPESSAAAAAASAAATAAAVMEGASVAPGVVLTLSPAGGAGAATKGGAPAMRTVGEMRAESARRAQMVSTEGGGHQYHHAFGMMTRRDVEGGGAGVSYFTGGEHGGHGGGASGSGGVVGSGSGKGGGNGGGGKVSAPSTSSTASISSAGSAIFRARARLSRENQLYGEWFGGVVVNCPLEAWSRLS